MLGHLRFSLALLTGKGVVIEAVMTAAQYRVDGAVVVESEDAYSAVYSLTRRSLPTLDANDSMPLQDL